MPRPSRASLESSARSSASHAPCGVTASCTQTWRRCGSSSSWTRASRPWLVRAWSRASSRRRHTTGQSIPTATLTGWCSRAPTRWAYSGRTSRTPTCGRPTDSFWRSSPTLRRRRLRTGCCSQTSCSSRTAWTRRVWPSSPSRRSWCRASPVQRPSCRAPCSCRRRTTWHTSTSSAAGTSPPRSWRSRPSETLPGSRLPGARASPRSGASSGRRAPSGWQAWSARRLAGLAGRLASHTGRPAVPMRVPCSRSRRWTRRGTASASAARASAPGAAGWRATWSTSSSPSQRRPLREPAAARRAATTRRTSPPSRPRWLWQWKALQTQRIGYRCQRRFAGGKWCWRSRPPPRRARGAGSPPAGPATSATLRCRLMRRPAP
mmetsp:Transcript_93678/g.279608  ORF Transcript_93678/g.279608 Transcript_93678/m.279608 type:complete len:377 (-) Transcript_93678:587-1717(-)